MPADFAAIVRDARDRAKAEAWKPKGRRLWLRCDLGGGGTVGVPVVLKRTV